VSKGGELNNFSDNRGGERFERLVFPDRLGGSQPPGQATVERLLLALAIGVWTLIAGRPPHKTRRAQFAHRASTLGV
jgi:hypothetical protein